MEQTDRNFRFTRGERLRGKHATDELFAKGDPGFVHPFRYMVRKIDGKAEVSILVTVPKRNHKKAVHRNLLKRRTREAYRLCKHLLIESLTATNSTLHLALVYTSPKIEEYKTIEDAVKKIISRLAAANATASSGAQ